MSLIARHSSLQMACRAGALVFLVAFWFDGGLFTLATASVFWILLELGADAEGGMKERFGKRNAAMEESLVSPNTSKYQ